MNKGKLFIKAGVRALLVGLQDVPMFGTVVKMGREFYQVLQEEQDKLAPEERIVQLEEAAIVTIAEARELAIETVQELQNAHQIIPLERIEAVTDLIAVMPATIAERTKATLSHAKHTNTIAHTVLPVTAQFQKVDREAFYTSLFPQRRPQFRAGDPLPHGNAEWKLEGLIGAGGFGEVWLARHHKMRSKPPMAIKFCQDEVSAKLLHREAANLDELMEKLPAGTPHIVALLDMQLTQQPYWLAFEYVAGGTLESRIRLGAMDWAAAWQLFEPILQGMSLVHDLNIVHRDLKPANILLVNGNEPRIADFGIGKLVAERTSAERRTLRSQSMTTRGYGSIGYMSPEQESGQPAHPADDTYALGIILWQMLTGKINESPQYPDDIGDLAVAESVKQLLSSCRFARREKRPQQARELLVLLSAPLPEPVEGTLRQAQGAQSQSQGQMQSQSQSTIQDIQHGHYIIHSNGTVTDTRTKLTWKRCCEGQTWNGKTCVGKAKKMSSNEIMPNEKQKYWLAFAGHNDWRVPTLDELKSLVYCSSGKPKTWNDTGESCEGEHQKPTIDQIAFPNTPAQWFWTSSSYTGDSSNLGSALH